MLSLDDYARRWRVTIDHVSETRTSHVAFGRRGADPVVLKLAKASGDETDSGAVAAAFAGHGVVRVLEHEPGAALLERLLPGAHLAALTISGEDERATAELARVVSSMREANPSVADYPTVERWGLGFDRYLLSGDRQIPVDLVHEAKARYFALCGTQRAPRLLHGDLQHYNVLEDETRGWVAIDPKGVVGEIEFELGPALRNPHETPALYSTSAAVERRVRQLSSALRLDEMRVLEWACAQGVLSAIWTVEDDGLVLADNPALGLVRAIRPLLNS
jgi:streptomycin 6-kinase